ncbi:ubiquitin thioesterase OTU1-like [Ostrea edulis]|uniref:ubiquitin thioesterase OTU1-like n=1 Tax=Ostrea edulis TaxID=37623 RepID=UPI002095FADD|nr:ubiquitin thioesterase OTU1-like [Ostrea edulis]XP_056001493.1 ubiquitin thioesterase OTU1-like [Ostrea edulis]XP_056001494.1 ubiquitin thioesterase OTU1-like [Ostrea edulis]XP_056001495.1 ubiquitin thioesterase OTU1-like [Ostrea edulis]XP_056001496.1 ubiquitin thioesterase OTU1-like [Ostrea edulis]XP_056001497.1 ubiquitin thioesterase OTU1-like [Ostrea edulis]
MASRPLQLRCKTKTGQHLLSGLNLNSQISELKDKIVQVTKFSRGSIIIRQGYPPKIIDISDENSPLSSLPFRSGDTLIVEENRKLQGELQQQGMDNVLQKQSMNSKGVLMRKVVPADNSCLFTSINALMNNGVVDLSCSKAMRDLIAGVVMSDPVNFSEAFLGKTNNAYCNWIRNADSWGGAIEVSILSQYFDVEIAVVDTQSSRIDRFGEDKLYKERIFVIYDGIHYDPLILEPLDPNLHVQTIFPTSDASVLGQAMEIASEAKSARQFTDVSNFSIKCLVCQKLLTGQSEAQGHAKVTGHINFGEV